LPERAFVEGFSGTEYMTVPLPAPLVPERKLIQEFVFETDQAQPAPAVMVTLLVAAL